MIDKSKGIFWVGLSLIITFLAVLTLGLWSLIGGWAVAVSLVVVLGLAFLLMLVAALGIRVVPAEPPSRGLLVVGDRRSQRDNKGEYGVGLGENEEAPLIKLLPNFLGPVWWATQTPGRVLQPGIYFINFLNTQVLLVQVTVRDITFESNFPTRDNLDTFIKVSLDWRPDFSTFRRKRTNGLLYRAYSNLYQFLDRRQDGATETERDAPIEKKVTDILMDAMRAFMRRYNLLDFLSLPEVLMQAELFQAISRGAKSGPRKKLADFLELADSTQALWDTQRKLMARERELFFLGSHIVRKAPPPKPREQLGDTEEQRDRAEARRERLEAEILELYHKEAIVLDKEQIASFQQLLDKAVALREELSNIGVPDRHNQGIINQLLNLADVKLPEIVQQELAQLLEAIAGIVAGIQRLIAAGEIDVGLLEGLRLEEITSSEGIEELARRGVKLPWDQQKILLDFRSILQERGEVFRVSGLDQLDLPGILRVWRRIQREG